MKQLLTVVLAVLFGCAAFGQSTVWNYVIYLESDQNPAFTALGVNAPTFAGKLDMFVQPNLNFVVVNFEITIPFTNPGVSPRIVPGSIPLSNGNAPNGKPLWGSAQITIDPGMIVNQAGIVVKLAGVGTSAPVVPLAIVQ